MNNFIPHYIPQIFSRLSAALLFSTALGSAALAQSLPELAPEKIADDVERRTDPRTGEIEYIAGNFDPFEGQDGLAGSAALRSSSGGTTINGQYVSGGAFLDISTIYTANSADSFDVRGFETARFHSGQPISVVKYDRKTLDCARSTNVVSYEPSYYRGASYGYIGGLYRLYPRYRGHRHFGWSQGSWNRNVFGGRYVDYRDFRRRGHRFDDGFGDKKDRNRRRRARDRNRDHADRPDHTRRDQDRNRNRARDRSRDRDQDRERHVDRRNRNGERAEQRRRNRDGENSRRRNRDRQENTERPPRRDRAETNTGPRPTPSNHGRMNPEARNPETRNPETRNSNPRGGELRRAWRRAQNRDRDNTADRQPRRRDNASAPRPAHVDGPARSRPARNSRPDINRAVDKAFSRKSSKPPKRSQRGRNFYPGYYEHEEVSVSYRCVKEETLTLHIPRERIDAARFDGFAVMIIDNKGNEVPVFVPPNYVEGFRQAARLTSPPQHKPQNPGYNYNPPQTSSRTPIIYGDLD